jgi:Na+(H+)/acetate symporter ActP
MVLQWGEVTRRRDLMRNLMRNEVKTTQEPIITPRIIPVVVVVVVVVVNALHTDLLMNQIGPFKLSWYKLAPD